MVVCKFFQEGYCRFGQNCRFEHIYGSKYSYQANAPPQAAPQAQSGVTDEQLVQQVHTDVQSALKGGQWVLSCYAPFKEKPIFPGISDLSPEEARLFIYEAKANNNVEQAVAYMNNLTKEARSKYEQLLTTTPNILKVLRSLYKGETSSSPFSSGQTPQNIFGSQSQNPSSLFRSANQQNVAPFGQTNANGIFNQEMTQDTPQSLFSQANNANSMFSQGYSQDAAQSIFSQASQNVFGAQPTQNQNFFGAADTAKSIFAQANKSPFESVPQPTSQPFKSPFDQPSPFAQNNSNVFQNDQAPANIFGQAASPFQQPPLDDPGVYSNVNDISAEDLEMFKADSFKIGFIPEIPPPHSLCI